MYFLKKEERKKGEKRGESGEGRKLFIGDSSPILRVKILPGPKVANYSSVTTCPGLERPLPVLIRAAVLESQREARLQA